MATSPLVAGFAPPTGPGVNLNNLLSGLNSVSSGAGEPDLSGISNLINDGWTSMNRLTQAPGGSGTLNPIDFNGVSQALSTPANSAAQSQQAQNTQALHQGLLGLLSNIWNHTGAPVVNDLHGGLSGFDAFQNVPSGYKDFGPTGGALFGLLHPGQAQQADAQTIQQRDAMNGPGFGLVNVPQSPSGPVGLLEQDLGNWWNNTLGKLTNQLGSPGFRHFVNDVQTSPYSYIPGAAIAKPVGMVAKATGLTPAMKYLGDLMGGTLKTGAEAVTNPTVDETALKGFDNLTAPAEKPLLGLPAPTAKATEVAPKFADNSNLINDWAFGPGNHYNEFGGTAWNYNPATVESVLNSVDPRVASKIEPMVSGLMQNVEKPAILGQAGTMLPDISKLNKEGANAVQAYSDLLGTKPLLGSTAKGGTKAAAEKSFSDVADQLANVTHTGEVPETGFQIISNPANLPMIVKTGQNLPAVIQNLSKELAIPENAVAELADQATKDTKNLKKNFGPYATNAWQKAVGSKIAPTLEKLVGPDGVPLYKGIQQLLDRTFSTLPGTTKAFQGQYSRYFGTKAAQKIQRNNWLADVFKGTTPEEQDAFSHAWESTPEGQAFADPKLEAIRQQVEPVMAQAFKDAQAKGLIDEKLDPTRYNVARYLPHIYKEGRQLWKAGRYATDNPFLRNSVDAGKTRDLKGTIKDLNDKALTDPNQPTFETNAIKIFGHYFHQLDDAIASQDFKQAVHDMYAGKYTGKLGSMHPEAKSNIVTHALNGQTVAMPEAEAKILDNLGTKTEEGMASKIFRKVTNGSNQLMFLSSPLIHVVNNLGFQSAIHDPSILKGVPDYIDEALHGIKPGSDMERALKAGALNASSEIGIKGNSDKQLEQLVNSINGTGWRNSKLGKAAVAYKNFTPNVEKAYRTSAFMRALEHGLNEQDAANYVRSIFGGHIAPNTMSNFDRFMSNPLTGMPFWNWTKTALMSNAKNAMQHPLRYNAIAQALNSINQENTGHGMWGNKNPATVGLTTKDAQGNQMFGMPYFPAMDLQKLASSLASEGLVMGGTNFAWNRMNPVGKTAVQEVLQKQNPFTSDPYSILPVPGLSPNNPANEVGPFFGGKGPLIPGLDNPYVANAAQNVLPSGAEAAWDLGHLNQAGNGQDFLNSLIRTLTGATVTAPKPASAKEIRYQQSKAKAAQKKASKILAQRQQGGQ